MRLADTEVLTSSASVRRRYDPGGSAPSAPATALAKRARMVAMDLVSTVGWVLLASRTINRSRSGSIQIEVPVKPVWPKARGDSSSPEERGDGRPSNWAGGKYARLDCGMSSSACAGASVDVS